LNQKINALKKDLSPISSDRIIPFSAKTNYGKSKILNWIDSKL